MLETVGKLWDRTTRWALLGMVVAGAAGARGGGQSDSSRGWGGSQGAPRQALIKIQEGFNPFPTLGVRCVATPAT